MSSPASSPNYKTTARRASQYKATTTPVVGSAARRKSNVYSKKPAASTSQWSGNLSGTEPRVVPPTAIARERSKQKYLENSRRGRDTKIMSGRKSDIEDMDMDMNGVDEDEDGYINDQVRAYWSL